MTLLELLSWRWFLRTMAMYIIAASVGMVLALVAGAILAVTGGLRC